MLRVMNIQRVGYTISVISLVLIPLMSVATLQPSFAADTRSLQQRVTDLERQIVELRNRLDRLEKSIASPQPRNPSEVRSTSTPQRDARVSIETINGITVSERQPCKVGYKNELRGTFTDASFKAYVIVKPLNGNPNWYVQPPAPVVPTGDGRAWIGKAFPGTPTAGVGDQFSIFVVVTNETYKGEQQLSSEPKGITSNRITCERTQ